MMDKPQRDSSFARSEDDLGIIKESKRLTLSSVLKYSLLFMQAAVLVASVSTFIIGIYTHEVKYGSKVVSGLIGADMYQVDSIMMIAAGASAILVTSLGIIGVVRRNKCMLGLHLCSVAFVSLTIFVAGFLGYIFISELESTAKKAMMDSITESYGVYTQKRGKNYKITTNWDSIQRNFKCCGVHGTVNSTTSWAVYKLNSFWVKDKLSNHSLVPESCCTPDSDMDLCTGRVYSGGAPSVGPPIKGSMVNYTLYTTGCYDQLEGYLEQNGIMLGTAAIVTAVFMVIMMILGYLQYRSIKS